MASLNRCEFIGHVGKNPEIFNTASGKKVCNLSLATTESYTKNNEKVSTTEWHRLIFWDKLAEIVEKYVTKGKQIYVAGKLKTRSYDDKEGKKVYITEIFVHELILLGSAQDGTQKSEPKQGQKTDQHSEQHSESMPAVDQDDPGIDNDLPF